MEDANVQRDIPYIAGGHPRQTLDIYLAQGTDRPAALVVWIHGGAWRAGNKDNCPATFLTQHGFVVASVNYRLSQHAIFPAQIEDCKAAIRFLRANAAKYMIDPDRIGVWGSSAGGHLVALLGTSGDVKELEQLTAHRSQSSRVQAVCDYFGPTDFLLMNQQAGESGRIDHDRSDSPESQLVGGPIQEKPVASRRASPLTYISQDDPPFLIVHGDKDPLVPLQQSKLLHQQLLSVGCKSEFVIQHGGGHGPFRRSEDLQRVRQFFEMILRDD